MTLLGSRGRCGGKSEAWELGRSWEGVGRDKGGNGEAEAGERDTQHQNVVFGQVDRVMSEN